MSSTSDDTQPAMTYPTSDQYARWKARADELDMSVSEFMQAMVEAGIKVDRGFELDIERDESRRELREQRNDLKKELEHARDRIVQLESQLHRGERAAIVEFVEDNPGATHAEVGQHIIDTYPERLKDHVEFLEGEEIRIESDRYYPLSDESEGSA